MKASPLNRKLTKITFKSEKPHYEAASKFFTIALIGLAFNTSLMSVMIKNCGLYYFYSQIVATGVVLVWNFIGNRLWTFKVGD